MKVTTNLLLIAVLLVALNSQAATLSTALPAGGDHSSQEGRSAGSGKAGSNKIVYSPPASGP